ncbi:MAG: HTH-type transcriptional regulator mcbR [Marmoricola sp.]|nr:HTH-type transcriptional regulator mcbR [Marmoricola sp.]
MAGNLRTRSLPEEVAAYVRELILTGELRPGEFLRLEPIAEAIGVSNTPVREGLLALRAEGFVQLVARRGFMVEAISARDVRDIFWAQAKLAGELAARAAKNITPEQVAHLDKLREAYDAAVDEGGDDRIAEAGHAFHRYINHVADSGRLASILGSIVQQLPNRFYATVEGHVEATRDDHRQIVEAMRKQSSRTARKLTEEHILELADHLVDLLAKRGLWDDAETA